jgi:hypothetical protein
MTAAPFWCRSCTLGRPSGTLSEASRAADAVPLMAFASVTPTGSGDPAHEMSVRDGRIRLPDRPGIGFQGHGACAARAGGATEDLNRKDPSHEASDL